MVGSRTVISLESLIEEYVAKNAKSKQLYERARKSEPGGNSRTGIFFGPFPIFAERGEGIYMIDADGNRRVDYVNNNTSLMLANAHPAVVRAIQETAVKGTAFARPTEIELELAEMLRQRVPSMESLRFCNSGTEAVLNALRVAKAYTGRYKIAKAEGAYHGIEDHVIISLNNPPGPWSGPAHRPQPVPATAGIAPSDVAETIILPYNDIENSRQIIEEHANELAAVIIDPMMTSACMIPMDQAWANMLREVTAKHGIMLIFDEIISFRVARGGMQEKLGIKPDLTTLAKVPMGGLAGGVWGGRADVMSLYDPSRGTPLMQQSGTFNGNPLTMAAGIATLNELTPEAYAKMDRLGGQLRSGLGAMMKELGVPNQVTGEGSLFWIHFTAGPVRNYRDTLKEDSRTHQKLFFWLINNGIYTYNKGMGCISVPMEEEHIALFISKVRQALIETGIA